jgi:hypothetical protein
MQEKYIPTLAGCVKDYHERVIPDGKCTCAANIIFKNGTIRNRYGYYSFGTGLPLNGSVTGLHHYEQIRTTVRDLVAFTRRDAYVYHSTTTPNWQYITKIYITGTATCAGVAAVTGGGGTAWNTLTHYDTYAQIKFGTNDPNGTGTPDTWYTVLAFTGANTLNLTGAGPNTGGAVAYVIRLCFTGADNQLFDVSAPIDPPGNEAIMVICNGVDPIQKWAGSGYLSDLGGSPPTSAYYTRVYSGHTFLADYYDAGARYPQSVWISDLGDPENWTTGTSGQVHLDDTNDFITGLELLNNKLYIIKENSITECYYTGDAAAPFNFVQNKFNVGTPSGKTIVNTGEVLIFYTYNRIVMFDGTTVKDIGADIIQYLTGQLNTDEVDRNHAFYMEDENLYVLTIVASGFTYPVLSFAYNIKENHWTLWSFSKYMTATCNYIQVASQAWNSFPAGFHWEHYIGKWGDRNVSGMAPVIIMGSSDGYIYRMSYNTYTDNGTSVPAWFVTGDFDLDDPKSMKKYLEIIIKVKPINSASFFVRVSTDYGDTYSSTITVPIATGAGGWLENHPIFDNVINILNSGKQIRLSVSNYDQTLMLYTGYQFHVESILIGYEPDGISVRR